MNKLFFWIVATLICLQIAYALETVTGDFVYSQGSFIVDDLAPVIEASSEVIGAEGDLITIDVNASDPNGNSVTIYYGLPFNESGEWQTSAGDGGIYHVTITASDGNVNSTTDVIIKITPFCGDANCNAEYGETCSTCSSDCGQCPSQGGKSGSGRSSTSEEVILVPDITPIVPVVADTADEKKQGAGEGLDSDQSIKETKVGDVLPGGVLLVSEDLGITMEIVGVSDGENTLNKDKIGLKINLIRAFEIKGENAKINVKYLIVPLDAKNAKGNQNTDNILTGAATYDNFEAAIAGSKYSYYLEEIVEVSINNVYLIREIDIPENLRAGKYKIVIIAEHDGKVAVDEAEFEVTNTMRQPTTRFKIEMPDGLVFLIILLIVGVVAMIKVKEKCKDNKKVLSGLRKKSKKSNTKKSKKKVTKQSVKKVKKKRKEG